MPANLPQRLDAHGVRFVRIVWCDNANVVRAKAVHVGALAQGLPHGVGISAAQQAVPVTADAFVAESGLGPVGEIRLVPDWETLKVLPFARGHARVYGDMLLHGKPWAYCPRTFLKRMVARGERLGLTFQTAFENEFYLLQDGKPVDRTLFASVQGMNQNRAFAEQLAEALLAQDIPVMQFYAESGQGQLEMSIGHADPLVAADRQLAFRETVHATAHDMQRQASFLPKIFADQAGSGCHVHLSLWRDARPLRFAPETQAFIAGILEHLPALMAITTPTPNSYRRLLPHHWSGAFRCWGMDNREAAVRVLSDPGGGEPDHFELKTVDASSNPYLALGAILAAGLDGVERELELGEGATVDPGLTHDYQRLPASLADSLQAFRDNAVLSAALGPELAHAFACVRERELEQLRGLELEQEVQLLLDRY
jgi:glutamine synthetase